MSNSHFPNHRPRVGIDQISTRWAMIQDPVKFVMRYAPAIQGYLSVFLKNSHDVEDVCQAFLVRIIERGVIEEDRLHGRFRDYLIAAVRNAALAHLRRRRSADHEVTPLEEIPARESFEFPPDEEWLSRWRRVVLASVWEALENHERTHPGNLAHTVLRTLVDHPQEDSTKLAARVSSLSGRTIQAEAFRKQVSRARRLFAELLVAETARTLDDPTPLKVEEELSDIGVMKYVQPYLPPDWRTSGKLLEVD
jgi:RNA polymerase sigma factor (sigma-70 family)